jgi:hypothetical protein
MLVTLPSLVITTRDLLLSPLETLLSAIGQALVQRTIRRDIPWGNKNNHLTTPLAKIF